MRRGRRTAGRSRVSCLVAPFSDYLSPRRMHHPGDDRGPAFQL